MEGRRHGRQLADAYRLKRLLDEQIRMLEGLERQPDAMTGQQVREATENMKETTGQIKRIAEEEPTRRDFGQPLRDALSDENKQALDAQCDSLAGAQDDQARKQAAGVARAGLENVSRAFDESQPRLLAELRRENALQPGGQRSLERGIGRLKTLLQAARENRRLAPDAQRQLKEDALANIRESLEQLDPDSKDGALRPLREFYPPGAEMDERVLQRLIEHLETLSVELVAVRSEEPKHPDVRYIDPAKLPPAYRDRIRMYFEKLAERK